MSKIIIVHIWMLLVASWMIYISFFIKFLHKQYKRNLETVLYLISCSALNNSYAGKLEIATTATLLGFDIPRSIFVNLPLGIQGVLIQKFPKYGVYFEEIDGVDEEKAVKEVKQHKAVIEQELDRRVAEIRQIISDNVYHKTILKDDE